MPKWANDMDIILICIYNTHAHRPKAITQNNTHNIIIISVVIIKTNKKQKDLPFRSTGLYACIKLTKEKTNTSCHSLLQSVFSVHCKLWDLKCYPFCSSCSVFVKL